LEKKDKKKCTESTNNEEHNGGKINYTKGSKMKKIVIKKIRMKIKIKK